MRPAPTPSLRLVALGASNLVRMLPRLVRAVTAAHGGPIEVLTACGHGRSFGLWSRYMVVRGLPGIRRCGLWEALDRSFDANPGRPTIALITDVGNDIAYGRSSDVVRSWVADCVERLVDRGARVALTLPPVTMIERLPGWRFTMARILLFPGRGLEHGVVAREIRAVAAALERLAGRLEIATIDVDPAWYGVDPIHWHARGRDAVIDRLLGAWSLASASSVQPNTRQPRPAEWLAMRTAQAEETRWLRFTARCRQPYRRLGDGTTLGLY